MVCPIVPLPPPDQASLLYPEQRPAMPQNVALWMVLISRAIVIPGVSGGYFMGPGVNADHGAYSRLWRVSGVLAASGAP